MSRGKHSKPGKPVVYTLLFVAVALMAAVLVAGRFGIGGLRVLIVESGSMEPAIRRHSVLVVAPVARPESGAVVTYRHDDDPNILITHRVVGYEGAGPDLRLVTKGDANDAPDEPVDLDRLVGQVRLVIPGLGGLVAWARTDLGFIVLIVIPATVVIHAEILRLREHLAEERRRRRDDTSDH